MNRATVVPDGEEKVGVCTCCARPMYSGCGGIVVDDEEVAGYWYRWSEGHEGRFVIAIAWEENEDYVATAWGDAAPEGISYGIQEISDSPWGEMSDYGRHLGRQELLESIGLRTTFFELGDILAANESNLSLRIKERYDLL